MEQAVLIFRCEATTTVLYRNNNSPSVVPVRPDRQSAGTIGNRLHRFDSVHDQVDDHLLKLDPVREH